MKIRIPAVYGFIMALSSLSLSGTVGFAEEVRLAWNPSPDSGVDGYRIHVGDSSASYQWSVDVGNDTIATIDGLNPGATYYFAATAYDLESGRESSFSNEIDVLIEGEPPPVAPTADFTADPTSGDAPLVVSFVDTSSGDVDAWSWDFGDGTSSAAEYPSHTYHTPGRYTVSLRVTGPAGTDGEVKSELIDVGSEPTVTPAITSPAPGSMVSSGKVTFRWTANGAAVARWRFQIGSVAGANDLFSSRNLSGRRTGIRVRRLRVSTGMIFVRLWFKIAGVWHYVDEQYPTG